VSAAFLILNLRILKYFRVQILSIFLWPFSLKLMDGKMKKAVAIVAYDEHSIFVIQS
jgi:hypothetical protein